MKIVCCFLILPFVLIAVPAQANEVAFFGGVQHEGKLTLNNAVSNASTVTFNPKELRIQVSAGVAFAS
jgi:hypothetical protein